MSSHENKKQDIDAISGVETTGHEWDGIKELNNPLPKWWLYIFYICIIWSIIYWVLFPAWPLATTYTKGLLGHNDRAIVTEKVTALKAERAITGAGLETASLEEIRSNENLLTFALAQGKAAFGDNCAACHGSGAAGFTGYPNLNDDDWLWGGTLDDIYQTLLFGIRSGHDEARFGNMLAFGADGILTRDEISDVVSYVEQIGGLEPEDMASVERGKALFADNCASCHGEAGMGEQSLGAPNLTDSIWLYGSTRTALMETIINGRAGVMPGWQARLDDVTIKSLTVYVHSLGGGQ